MNQFQLYLIIGILFTGCAVTNLKEKRALHNFRAEHIDDLVHNPRGPLSEDDVSNLSFYPFNAQLSLTAIFTKNEAVEPFMIATYSGRQKPFIKYGTLAMVVDETPIELALYQNVKLAGMEGYEQYLFLPFKDLTNGDETYGGGRYIDVLISDIVENRVQIDFNKCYNPWCAYSDGYNCPVPPLENHLPIPIRAGEKNYLGEKKKA